MPLRIAHLGPPGTFTEEATLRYAPDATLLPLPSVAAAAEAVDAGMADEAVVAIENSLDGSVNDTLDLLIHESTLRIRRELVLPIEQWLLGKPGTQVTDIKVIYSHPQALGQCRRFLQRCFPQAQAMASLSTTAAVHDAMASPVPAAAISPRRAAALYGAEILAKAIQDYPNNETRFVVLAATDHEPTGADKTSLCFSFAEDHPGQLVAVLSEFAERNINLAKVESRPTKTELGRYVFLLDCEGHRLDPIVAAALAQAQARTSLFKIFGSYPRWTENRTS